MCDESIHSSDCHSQEGDAYGAVRRSRGHKAVVGTERYSGDLGSVPLELPNEKGRRRPIPALTRENEQISQRRHVSTVGDLNVGRWELWMPNRGFRHLQQEAH